MNVHVSHHIIVTCKWLILSVISIGFAVAQWFGIRLFYSMRDWPIIQKRYPTLALAESIIAFVALLIIYPVTSIPSCILDIPRWMIELTQYAAIQSIVAIETGRLWLMSFDLHCLRYSQNQRWKSVIDVSLAEPNWYFEHKHRYGNEKNIAIVVTMYVLTITTVNTIIWIIVDDDDDTPHVPLVTAIRVALTFLVAPIITAFIYFPIRKYDSLRDSCFFFFEMKTTVIIETMSLLSGIGVILLNIQILKEIVFPMAALCAMTPSLLSTLYIPMKIKARMNAKRDNEVRFCELNDVLKNGEKFDSFMVFMLREFSSENALSFLEFVQFKRYIVRMKADESDLIGNDGTIAEITVAESPKDRLKYIDLCCDSVPISSINGRPRPGMDEMEKCRNMAHELYLKYIKEKSRFEINISSDLRGKYDKYEHEHWDLPADELLIVFDDAMFIMRRFMYQSFCRYKQSLRK